MFLLDLPVCFSSGFLGDFLEFLPSLKSGCHSFDFFYVLPKGSILRNHPSSVSRDGLLSLYQVISRHILSCLWISWSSRGLTFTGYKFDEHDRDSATLRLQFARYAGPRSAWPRGRHWPAAALPLRGEEHVPSSELQKKPRHFNFCILKPGLGFVFLMRAAGLSVHGPELNQCEGLPVVHGMSTSESLASCHFRSFLPSHACLSLPAPRTSSGALLRHGIIFVVDQSMEWVSWRLGLGYLYCIHASFLQTCFLFSCHAVAVGWWCPVEASRWLGDGGDDPIFPV